MCWKPLKLKLNLVSVQGGDELRVYPPENSPERMLFALHKLKLELPHVVVRGIPTVSRAVIKDDGQGELKLLVEGTNLCEVMGTVGVDGLNTTSNHVLEVEEVLGIEAARVTIANEIQTTMDGHGLTVDARHVMLLADIMSYKGFVVALRDIVLTPPAVLQQDPRHHALRNLQDEVECADVGVVRKDHRPSVPGGSQGLDRRHLWCERKHHHGCANASRQRPLQAHASSPQAAARRQAPKVARRALQQRPAGAPLADGNGNGMGGAATFLLNLFRDTTAMEHICI